MPKGAKAACVEEFSGDSDNGRAVPGTRVSANIPKEEKKKSKRDSKKDRPHRKEKKSHSDDGILQIPKQDDEDTIADSVRVLPEERKETRRRSMASAPVNGNHSPRKSASRTIPGRERSVTFDQPARHDKNDPSYFGRKHGEDVRYTPNASRPPLTAAPKMRSARPMSFDGRTAPPPFQSVYSPLVHTPMYASSPAPYMAPPMPGSYDGAYFGHQPPNGLAARFGRTGQPTLNTAAPLEYIEPRPDTRRDPRHSPRRREIEYEEDEDEEDEENDYYTEQGMRAEAAAEERRKERQRQNRILAAAEQVLEQKRIDDSRKMPPPEVPRREISQRTPRRPPHVDYPSREDMREQHRDHLERPSHTRRDSSASERPQMYHRQTEPVRSLRRPSFGAAPFASSGGYDLPRRSRHPSVEISNPNGRRTSYHGGTSGTGTTTSSTYEEQERAAMGYQNDVAGDAPPLTTEWLKQQQKAIGAGSRSTRSTISRDESEMKQSATTRTTRSGSGDGNENATFTIKGNATVTVDGAEISTRDTDGPIEISIKRNSDQKAIRNGSEASWAPSAMSGMSGATTAVSDDLIARRLHAERRESRHSYKPSAENARYDPRHEPRHDPVREHRLRERLEPLARRPSNARRESHRPRDFERDPSQWL